MITLEDVDRPKFLFTVSVSPFLLVKTWAPRCVYCRKESVDLELQIIKPKECQW